VARRGVVVRLRGETKGLHLKNENTAYKQSVFALCNKHAKKKAWNELVPAMRGKEISYEVVFQVEWEKRLNELLPRGAKSPRASLSGQNALSYCCFNATCTVFGLLTHALKPIKKALTSFETMRYINRRGVGPRLAIKE